jgi:hypothetical protein
MEKVATMQKAAPACGTAAFSAIRDNAESADRRNQVPGRALRPADSFWKSMGDRWNIDPAVRLPYCASGQGGRHGPI